MTTKGTSSDALLAEIKKKIAAKPEAVLTIRKPLAGGTDLRDEDIEVLTVKVRVPSSALLEDISISRGSTDVDTGLTLADNDSTDPVSADITDTI